MNPSTQLVQVLEENLIEYTEKKLTKKESLHTILVIDAYIEYLRNKFTNSLQLAPVQISQESVAS